MNLVRLAPGAWSSQRHWHTHEDEFVYVLSGELVLVTDDRRGSAGRRRQRGLSSRRAQRALPAEPVATDATFLVAGNRSNEDGGEYSDIDMAFKPGRYTGGGAYFHKDGSPY